VKREQGRAIASNRAAYHDYYIEDTYEAGISLSGTEVKSIRLGHVNLKDSYAYFKGGELFIQGMHVSPYEKGNIMNKDPLRHRKLLLNKRELKKLRELSQKSGYALIPTDLHFSGPYVKVGLSVAKGKKLYDKREVSAEKDAKRNMQRTQKELRI